MPEELRGAYAGRIELRTQGDDPANPLSGLEGAHAAIAAARLRYDAALMERAPALRVISRMGAGYDNVNVEDATRHGIALCTAPLAVTTSTAEHAFLLILAVSKRLTQARYRFESAGKPDYFGMHTGLELRGLTLGLVGLGRIGRHVARIANGFEMNVLALDPFVDKAAMGGLGIEKCEDLHALLRRSDIVSLHAPLNEANVRMINTETLGLMKRGAVLVNTARGGLVDESALLEALESGHLAGAGLDVLSQEPPATDHPLLGREDVIVTPHVAAATSATKRRLWEMAIEHALDVLEGRTPPFVINPEYAAGPRAAIQ